LARDIGTFDLHSNKVGIDILSSFSKHTDNNRSQIELKAIIQQVQFESIPFNANTSSNPRIAIPYPGYIVTSADNVKCSPAQLCCLRDYVEQSFIQSRSRLQQSCDYKLKLKSEQLIDIIGMDSFQSICI